MKFLISIFWAFIFSCVSIFLLSSLLGENTISKGFTPTNIIVLSVSLIVGVALLDYISNNEKKK